MYLLDTDTVVYALKGNDAVKRNLAHHLRDPLRLSIITIMELYFGAYKSQRVQANLAKLKMLENDLQILPVGMEVAEVFGMCKAKLEKAGTPLDDFDLIVASTALTRNLTLVTNNLKHFKRIEGLRLTNWTVFPESPNP